MADKNSLGISLDDIKTAKPKVENKQNKQASEIAAYSKDALRSVIVGVISVGILLVLYFAKVIK